MTEATTCTMCEAAPATTTWGFPVCQDCADGLDWLDGELAREEAGASSFRQRPVEAKPAPDAPPAPGVPTMWLLESDPPMQRPLRHRLLNRLRAFLGGHFWLPCPLCHQCFGGHEVGDVSVGTRAACKAHNGRTAFPGSEW